MGLEIGSRLSSYEILAPIGAGAMGEVYRARDTHLEREVAIKVLPAEFAEDADRLGRFEREAKLLAAVHHPNIATIFAVERVDETQFIVLEFVPGTTLGERIGAGPIPIPEVLDFARQIADGLEAAHEAGVVHRDLKPDNIHVTPDDTVKLLDFGLAKAVPAAGSDSRRSPTDCASLTQTGMFIGTPYYMSPEQVRGRPVDRRADIWAFGCVLFESLTGERAFPGGTLAEVSAAVLEHEPLLDRLPSSTPRRLRALISDCLNKDAMDRLRDIGDARRELGAIRDGAAEAEVSAEAGDRSAGWRWPVAFVLAIAVAAIAGGLLFRSRPTTAEPIARPVVRFSYELPQDVRAREGWEEFITIAPDGSSIAFIGERKDTPQVFIQNLADKSGRDAWRALDDTRDAVLARFSSDSKSLVVHTWAEGGNRGELKRVYVERRPSEPILTTPRMVKDVAWDSHGALWVLEESQLRNGEERTIPLPTGSTGIRAYFLPDAKHVLVSTMSTTGDGLEGVKVLVLSLDRGAVVSELESTGYAEYLSSGHLIFSREGAILAQPFDLERLAPTGETVPLANQVWRFRSVEGGRFAIAAEAGMLVHYRGAKPVRARRRLVTVDPATQEVSPFGSVPPAEYWGSMEIAKGGDVLVVAARKNGRMETHVSMKRGAPVSRPRHRGLEYFCLSRSGDTLIGGEGRPGMGIYRVGVSEGARELVVAGEQGYWLVPVDVSPDGRRLVYARGEPGSHHSLQLLRLDSPGAEPVELVPGHSWLGFDGRFSPDGTKFGYSSDRLDHDDVYVLSFDDIQNPKRVTTSGGYFHNWSADGKTIYFTTLKRWFAAVDADGGESRGIKKLFDQSSREIRNASTWYSAIQPLPDGRFLMLQQSEEEFDGPRLVDVVLNFRRRLRGARSGR